MDLGLLLQKIAVSIDTPVVVEIHKRDADGKLLAVASIPIARIAGALDEKPARIIVSMADIENATWRDSFWV